MKIVISGPQGCGKSTVANIIARALKEADFVVVTEKHRKSFIESGVRRVVSISEVTS